MRWQMFHLLSVNKQENCAVIILLISKPWLVAFECCFHNSLLDSCCFSFIFLLAPCTPWYPSPCSFTRCCCFTYLHKYTHTERESTPTSELEGKQWVGICTHSEFPASEILLQWWSSPGLQSICHCSTVLLCTQCGDGWHHSTATSPATNGKSQQFVAST